MRLDIYGQFVVSVVRPNGGWSKGRAIAVIEDRDAWRPVDLLIPNDLRGRALERCVASRFSAFARPGKHIRRLDPRRHHRRWRYDDVTKLACYDKVGRLIDRKAEPEALISRPQR
jgi:hypothetical protein